MVNDSDATVYGAVLAAGTRLRCAMRVRLLQVDGATTVHVTGSVVGRLLYQAFGATAPQRNTDMKEAYPVAQQCVRPEQDQRLRPGRARAPPHPPTHNRQPAANPKRADYARSATGGQCQRRPQSDAPFLAGSWRPGSVISEHRQHRGSRFASLGRRRCSLACPHPAALGSIRISDELMVHSCAQWTV